MGSDHPKSIIEAAAYYIVHKPHYLANNDLGQCCTATSFDVVEGTYNRKVIGLALYSYGASLFDSKAVNVKL